MKKLLAFLLCLACVNFAQATVNPNSVASSFTEGKEYSVKGNNLDSGANPFTATVITASGAEISLPTAVNNKGTKAKFVIPTVAQDLKVTLRISGGNVLPADAQDFLALILNKPNGFNDSNDNTISDTPVAPDDTDSGFIAGQQGPQGPDGAQGNDGPPGPSVTDGGQLDANTLPIEFVYEGALLVTGDAVGNIDLDGANFFIINDSDTNSVNSFSTITGATSGVGSPLKILFKAEVFVYDSDFPSANEINLGENSFLMAPRNNNRYYSPGEYFYPGDTLELLFDGNAWYEVSRSRNTNLRS